jgi:hypothetical protein
LLARPLPIGGKGLYFFSKDLYQYGKGLFLLFIKMEVSAMKKAKVSFLELLKQNKDEILKDKKKLENIEKRIEEKYIKK